MQTFRRMWKTWDFQPYSTNRHERENKKFHKLGKVLCNHGKCQIWYRKNSRQGGGSLIQRPYTKFHSNWTKQFDRNIVKCKIFYFSEYFTKLNMILIFYHNRLQICFYWSSFSKRVLGDTQTRRHFLNFPF